MSDTLQTEFEFTLPQGYVADDGTLHKEGRMRLATAADEIKPLKDPRVQSNSSYLTVILLSRVVTQLGDIESVTPEMIEELFVSDLEYLQGLYERINNRGEDVVDTACPDCGEAFGVAVQTGRPVATADQDGGIEADPPAAGGPAPGSGVPEMDTADGMEPTTVDTSEGFDSAVESEAEFEDGQDQEDAELGNPAE